MSPRVLWDLGLCVVCDLGLTYRGFSSLIGQVAPSPYTPPPARWSRTCGPEGVSGTRPYRDLSLWTCVGFRCSAGDDAARAGWSRCRWLRGHAAGGCVVTLPVAATWARATVDVLASRWVLWMAAAVSHGPALGNAEVCQHGGDFLVAALALVEGSAHRVAMCASRIACRKGRSCILCIAAQRLAQCNPMHNQPPDILRSRPEAFPWAGVWVDLPLSAVSDRDDTTPASVRAGRSAEAVACPALCRAGILCTAQQTSRNFPLLRAYGP